MALASLALLVGSALLTGVEAVHRHGRGASEPRDQIQSSSSPGYAARPTSLGRPRNAAQGRPLSAARTALANTSGRQ